MKQGQFARRTVINANAVAEARSRTGLTQTEFASVLCISVRTLQEWEQGRRHPSGAARTLVQIAARHPEVITEALSEMQ
ncbi:helix-turn-helix domain-containing protein [Parahaliea maris]|uniref:Helix-turn-helix domain-containing protein n=2 Tax=Parahaliea maris TaxID=2716870 RepID=A0A5C9AB88_9GAMM|nr:helix-turn-helix domain-containing protein [Parahaliea maris]